MQDNQHASHLAVPSNLFAVTPYKQQQHNKPLMHKHGSSQHWHNPYFQSGSTNATTYYIFKIFIKNILFYL